jgi:hypothetical protein
VVGYDQVLVPVRVHQRSGSGCRAGQRWPSSMLAGSCSARGRAVTAVKKRLSVTGVKLPWRAGHMNPCVRVAPATGIAGPAPGPERSRDGPQGRASTQERAATLDRAGGEVAARPAGNRPVRVRAQGSRARRRRRGRSLPWATVVGVGRGAGGLVVARTGRRSVRRRRSSPAPSWQGPHGQPRPAGRGGQPPGALAPAADPLADLADGPAGEGDGGGDPDRRRRLDR